MLSTVKRLKSRILILKEIGRLSTYLLDMIIFGGLGWWAVPSLAIPEAEALGSGRSTNLNRATASVSGQAGPRR
jgi:hypothetical protein